MLQNVCIFNAFKAIQQPLIKQNGAFILFGLEDIGVPMQEENKKIGSPSILCKLIISNKMKKEITKTLDQCGISLATMYPELYKVAEYLKNSKLKI